MASTVAGRPASTESSTRGPREAPLETTAGDRATQTSFSIVDALEQVDALTGEGRWLEAVAPAEQIARAIADEAGPRSLRYANALNRLAEVQRRAGRLAEAELNFSTALELTESRTSAWSDRLIAPLSGLGLTLAALDEHARAAPVLDRALMVVRRSRGLFDPSQLEILEQFALSQTAIGNFADAEQTLRYGVRVAEQAFGSDDPRVARSVSKLAQWYSEAGAYDIARQYYRSAIDLVERHSGPEHPALVEPLRGLAANSMRAFCKGEPEKGKETVKVPLALQFESIRDDPRPGNRRRLTSDSENALERALAILRRTSSTEDSDTLVETLLQAGDWFLVKNQIARAHDLYHEAWLLSRGHAATPDQPGILDYPALIYLPPASDAAPGGDSADAASTQPHAAIAFTVNPEGRLEDIHVIERDASDRQVNRMINALEHSIYRPRFEAGRPAATNDVRHRADFVGGGAE